MPAAHNLNVHPYNDDFDPRKNFYRVMYKPGFPIQARELNQQQNILQDQFSQFGNSFYKDGDVITPGEFFLSNPVPYIRVSTITNGVTAQDYVGYNFTGAQSGVKARVIFATEATDEDDTTFYLTYEGQGANAEYSRFLEQETLESDHPDYLTAKVGVTAVSKPVTTPATGSGTLFTVTSGAYYVNGFVVRNEEQTITLDKYATDPNYQVGFIISEEFVTNAEDQTLLDNSQGYTNFAGPGADRLKITLTLGKLLIDSQTPDFISLCTVQNGSILGQTEKNIKWDWLHDILAKRTFDESGNYIVSDFIIKPLEYINADEFDGVFDPDPDTGEYPPVPKSGMSEPLTFDEAERFYAIRTDPGLAYVQGYEVGFSHPFYTYGNKPRSVNFIENTFTSITMGHHLTVTNCFGVPSFQNINEGSTIFAFDALVLYRTFIDGYVGEVTADGSRPISYGDSPTTTIHIVTDGPVGEIDDTNLPYKVLYNEGNSIVVSMDNPGTRFERGQNIGNSFIVMSTEIKPYATGVMRPKFFNPKQYTADDGVYYGYNSTFTLGFLQSTHFTELKLVFDLTTEGSTLDWKVGDLVVGLTSQSHGIVEKGSNNDVLILSNIYGDFVNGELIAQDLTEQSVSLVTIDGETNPTTGQVTSYTADITERSDYVRKVGRVLRSGEVSRLVFFNNGDSNFDNLADADKIEVNAIGLTTTLYKEYDSGMVDSDGNAIMRSHYRVSDKNELELTIGGREKLFNFPFPGGSVLNERVNYQLKAYMGETLVGNGFGIAPPAKIMNSLDKTKSVFSSLAKLNADKFSADVSMRNNIDSSVLELANSSLFSGTAGNPFIICDNYSGDPSEELIFGDIVTFVDDSGVRETKVVMSATKPVGYGQNRSPAVIYFTTSLRSDCNARAVQRLRTRVGGDETENLLYNMPVKTVSTLQSDPKTTRIDYKVFRQFVVQGQAGATSFTLTTSKDNEKFDSNPSNVSVNIVRNTSGLEPDKEGRFLRVKSISIDLDDDRQAMFEFDGPLPDNCVIKVIALINVINAQAKQKVTNNMTISVPVSVGGDALVTRNKLMENNIISLTKPDVYRLNWVSMTAPKGEPGAVDVTANYIFDDGQRDNYYDISRLFLVPGKPAAIDDLYINFDYFEHGREGDFFSVDSYTHDEGIRYRDIPTYTKGGTNPLSMNESSVVNIELRDVVDFRPTVDSMNSVIPTITPGIGSEESINFNDYSHVGTEFEGDAMATRIPVPMTDFRCDITYFLPRRDAVFLDKTGSLILLEGNPSVNPLPPADLSTAIRLYDLYLPAYLFDIKDIEVKKYNYRRYTMSDIASIDRKVENLTEVVGLTLLELSAINMSVRDAVTGLNRFKNGIIVDAFNDHSNGFVDSTEYRCSIDPVNTHLRASCYIDQIELEERNQTNNQRQGDKYVNNNGIVTVPYDDVDFLANPYATNSIKLHPFSAYTYHGSLKLDPEVDTNIAKHNKANVIVEDSALYDAMNALNATAEHGTIWGVWENVGTAQTTKHSDHKGNYLGSELKVGDILQSNIKLKGQTKDHHNTEALSIKKTGFGDRALNMQLSYNMRSIPVNIVAERLKPNTRYYAFFDDINVTDWISADKISSDFPDKVSRYVTPSNIDRVPFGEPFLSDDEGRLSGVFIVPNGRPPLAGTQFDGYMDHMEYDTTKPTRNFIWGERVLRFTTSPTNTLDADSVGSYTEAVFTSGQVLDDKQETVLSTRLPDLSTRTAISDRKSRTTTSTGIADIEVSARGPERLSRKVEVEKQNISETTDVVENEVIREYEVLNPNNDSETRKDIITERNIVAQQAPELVKFIEVEKKPDSIMNDPVAQTFLVDNTNKEGIFLTELEVFFAERDRDQSVMAYIVSTEGGVPSKTVVPHSKVVKSPDTTLRVKVELPVGLEAVTLTSGFIIDGQVSGASGVIKADVLFESPTNNPDFNVGNKVYNVILSNYTGDFIDGEIITTSNLSGLEGEVIFTIARDEYEITRVDLTHMGSAYDENTNVVFTEPELPGGRTASAVVKVAPNSSIDGHEGQVYEVLITDPGSGYVNVPEVSLEGAGTDAEAVVRTKPGRRAVSMGVATSDDATMGTRFKFDAPVYLMGDTEYAFVLESPNSIEYKLYTSTLGDTVINDEIRVTKQPALGTLFKSQNGSVWSEDQNMDIKFKLKRASFEVNTASKLQLNNTPLATRKIGLDPIETNSESVDETSNVFGVNPKVVKVYHYAHGLAPKDFVAISGVSGIESMVGGIPVEEINTLHRVLDSDLSTFTIMCSTSATESVVGGGDIVYTSYGMPYEVVDICTGMMTFGTSLVGVTNRSTKAVGLSVVDIDANGNEKRFNDEYRYILDHPRPIKLMDSFYYTEPMQIANSLNEVQYSDGIHLQGQKSVTTMIRMSTVSTRVSPVIDLQRTNYTVVRNIINKPKEFANIYGSASTVITFADTVDVTPNTTLKIDGIDTKVKAINKTKRSVLVLNPPHHNFTTDSVFESDEIDDEADIIDVATRVSEGYNPETRVVGSSKAKWISKTFVFDSPNDGIEIKLTSIFYTVDSIKVYYSTRSAGFDGDISQSPWLAFNPDGVLPYEDRRITPGNAVVRPGDSLYSTDLPYFVTPGLPDGVAEIKARSTDNVDPAEIQPSEWQTLTWTVQDIPKFDALSIKIVFMVENPALTPLVDEMMLVVSE